MPDKSADRSSPVASLLEAQALLDESRGAPDEPVVKRISQLLREVERATPGGAGLHTQLDTVAKWVALLARQAEHERFGGSKAVRDHVTMQFRLAIAATQDYLRATS